MTIKYTRMHCLILMLVLLLLTSCSTELVSENSPKAEYGVLDLSDWDFHKKGVVTFEGEWLLAWKRLITDSGAADHAQPDTIPISVPGPWNDHEINGKPLGEKGYGSYRLNIRLKDVDQNLAIRLPEIRTAFKVYVNGIEVTSVGHVGTDVSSSKPAYFPHIIYLKSGLTSLDLVIQVSNYHMRMGGIVRPVLLGTVAQIHKTWENDLGRTLFLIGCIILIGLYHLGVFSLRQNDKFTLYFFIFCTLIVLRMVVQGQYYLVQLIPNISWELVVKLNYLSFYLAAPVFMIYSYSMYPKVLHRLIIQLSILFGVVYSLIVVAFPIELASHTLLTYQIITLLGGLYLIAGFVSALFKRTEGTAVFLSGFAILFLTIINDILYDNNILRIGILVPFGLVAFVFAQAFLISLRLSRTFSSVQNLSVELETKTDQLNISNQELARLNETLEKKVEERTNDLNNMIEQLKYSTQNSEKLAREAQSANLAKSSFLANMSHEIRTPMNGVIGMLDLLMETDLDKEQLDYANTVQNSAEALLAIINDILDFSKIEAGKLDFEVIDFNLRTTIESITELLSVKANEKGLEFISMISSGVPQNLKGDPGRLKQILINLAGNAIKFTEKGEVVIKVKLEKQTVQKAFLRFEVVDTGIGIPEEKGKILFQSFSQVDSSITRKYGGTGLGLAISKQLTEMMNGQIGVESTPDEGSVFWFTAEFEKQLSLHPIKLMDPMDLKGIRVLVVDDIVYNRQILIEFLNGWGCITESAVDGEEGLQILNEASSKGEPYDLAIIDMLMPKMDGATLGAKIKESPDLKNTLMVMLTSSGLKGDAARAHEVGFSAYLTKPVRQTQLYDCLITVVGQQSMSDDPKFEEQLVTKHSLKEMRDKKAYILLAEDNKVNQKLAIKILEKAGYRVDVVENGKEVITALENTAYDLVLMDLQMPEMGGLETTKIIRAPFSNVINHEIPIIALTAHAMAKDEAECLEAGMNGYVSKPIRKDTLYTEIERLLEARQVDG